MGLIVGNIDVADLFSAVINTTYPLATDVIQHVGIGCWAHAKARKRDKSRQKIPSSLVLDPGQRREKWLLLRLMGIPQSS